MSVVTPILLGSDTHVHAEGKSKQGEVSFDASEDMVLFFDNPSIFDADTGFVKPGQPLHQTVRVDGGKTKCWLVRASDFDTFFRNPKKSVSKITRVAGSPIEITVP
jgi:hypothetical protein